MIKIQDDLNITPASNKDIPFIIDTIINSERSNTKILSYSKLYNLSYTETENLFSIILNEDIENCEFSLSSFLILKKGNIACSAACGWIESEIPSNYIKTAVLSKFIPISNLKYSLKYKSLLNEINIKRTENYLQLESFYTKPEFRGNGFAKILIKEFIKLHAEASKAQIILMNNNSAAQNAYKKAGFKFILEKTSDSTEIFKFLPSNGRILLEKEL